jgi:hypothetical protein
MKQHLETYLFQMATLQPDNIPVPTYLIQIDDGRNIWIDRDEATTGLSTHTLTNLVKCENVALTIYDHDAGQWATMKHAPEHYG